MPLVTKLTEVDLKGRKLTIPAGLRAAPVAPYPTQTRPQFWLEEFPTDLFPPNSIERHDAVHYGVWLEQSDVEEKP